jgi:hypothetical protein
MGECARACKSNSAAFTCLLKDRNIFVRFIANVTAERRAEAQGEALEYSNDWSRGPPDIVVDLVDSLSRSLTFRKNGLPRTAALLREHYLNADYALSHQAFVFQLLNSEESYSAPNQTPLFAGEPAAGALAAMLASSRYLPLCRRVLGL